MDFTLEKYFDLCKTISTSRYQTATVDSIISSLDSISLNDSMIILRHDVDRFPKQAMELAKIERDFDFVSSYYFRIPASFNEKIITDISKMGHEVGLHYECLDKSKGDITRAKEILEEELDMFRKLSKINTVSMHGNPLTKFDNRDLWQHYDFSQFKLTGEVYLSMDFEKIMYYSDTGRTWEDGKYNIKDVIPSGMKSISHKPLLRTTDDLINLINNDTRNIYLLIHPERWTASYFGWAMGYLKDFVLNRIKLVYKYTIGASK